MIGLGRESQRPLMPWRITMTVTQSHKLQLNIDVGNAQGYPNLESIIRAANRALRWVRQPRNQGYKPPSHIAQKMRLIKVTTNT